MELTHLKSHFPVLFVFAIQSINNTFSLMIGMILVLN